MSWKSLSGSGRLVCRCESVAQEWGGLIYAYHDPAVEGRPIGEWHWQRSILNILIEKENTRLFITSNHVESTLTT